MSTDPSTNIQIVFASNDKYALYLSTAIKSLIKNTCKNNHYEIIILDSDISDCNKKYLKKQERKNVSVKLINTKELYIKYKEIVDKFYTYAHFTKETYLRFLLPEVLRDYDKVLYLDCDICINSDIADLYNTDIGNKMIGASHSIEFIARYFYDSEIKNYADYTLKLHCVENYINAGIMLMNLKKMRESNLLDKLIEALNKIKTPLHVDQDIYNIVCEGDIYYIDPYWNFTWNPFPNGYEKNLKYLPEGLKTKYLEAQKYHKIIHYITSKKPIDTFCTTEYGQNKTQYSSVLWWKYA